MTQNPLQIGPLPVSDTEPGDPTLRGAHDSLRIIQANAAYFEEIGPALSLPPDMVGSIALNEDLSELEEKADEAVEGASLRGTDRHTSQTVVYVVRPGGPAERSYKRVIGIDELPKTKARVEAFKAKQRQAVEAGEAVLQGGGGDAALLAENAQLRAQLAEAEVAKLRAELAAAKATNGDAPAAPPAPEPETPSSPAAPDPGAAADKPEDAGASTPAPKSQAKRRAKPKPSSS